VSNHNLKEKMLGEYYEYSLPDIAENLYMAVNTASALEKKAIINFKTELLARGYTIKDLLPC
jgi:hypothetical protein